MVRKETFLQRMMRTLKLADAPVVNAGSVVRASIKREPIGSSGTKVYGGYFDEEYLKELTGVDAATKYDRMRRSDPQVRMCLSAVKNPIKSATWDIEAGSDDPKDVQIKEFVEHVLFCDLDKPFQVFLNEALTFIDFGYSIFEKTHKTVLAHPKFGDYIGYRSLGFRSQKTIQWWDLDADTGKIKSIHQNSYGDLQKIVDIPGEYLIVFTLDKEGDNYEGVSALRPCYGPWLRKQVYLKLNAIGIEKNAVPTPVGRVPVGQESSHQFDNFVSALEIWTSHQANYVTLPVGWDVEFVKNDFDPTKVESSIDAEDKRMVKSFLANFLELGMSGGGGSYALGNDQSDFFLGGIEHIAQQICDGMSNAIEEIVKLNYGPQENYPRLCVSGISDKAGKELSEIMKNLVDSKVITPDDLLEETIRKRYGLSAPSDIGQRQVNPPAQAQLPAPGQSMSERMKLAESKWKEALARGKDA